MQTAKQILDSMREKLLSSKHPMFFFDDDVDGVSSYLLLQKKLGYGKGVIIKSTPVLKEEYITVVERNNPDVVFILDKPQVEEAFFQNVRVPICWIDHHEPQKITHDHVTYFNPRLFDDADNRCTSYWAFQIAQENLWIAACGSVSDWQLNDATKSFAKQYPTFLDAKIKNPADALFDSPLGKIIRVLIFNLKGKPGDVRKSIDAMENIYTIEEISEKSTKSAQFLWKRFEYLSTEYDSILEKLTATVDKKKKFILYIYDAQKVSVTSELSNELLYRFPDKVICIARKKGDEYKCSLRSSENIELPPIVNKALVGVSGYGGGHTHACGACIKEYDFNKFISQIESQLQ